MKTPVAALAFALIAVLLERCNALPGEGELLFRSFEQSPQDLVEEPEENANYADDDRISVGKPSYSWSDCCGSRCSVRVSGFQMSSTCRKASDKLTIRYNITAASDISSPIKVMMDVRKKVGALWVNICGHVPGGCVKDNVCPNGGDLTFEGLTPLAEEAEPETAEVEENEDAYNNYQSNALPEAEACVKKGFFASPALTRDIAKVPDGQYRVRANFFTKDRTRIACLSVRFTVCK